MDGHVFQSCRPMVFSALAAAMERPTSVSQGCDGRFVDWKWLNIYRLGNNMLEYIMLFHCTINENLSFNYLSYLTRLT